MQSIDPGVSKLKFQQELNAFLASEAVHRKRGIFLIKARFPDMIFLFTAPQLRPHPIVFAVKINFDNYDLEPLSVQFVDPYVWTPVNVVAVPMYRKLIKDDQTVELQPLVQKEETGLPFICLPGIREYHRHPAHTGDQWLLHRKKGGEGSLGFILDKLFTYGIKGVYVYQIQVNAQAPALNISYHPNQIPE